MSTAFLQILNFYLIINLLQVGAENPNKLIIEQISVACANWPALHALSITGQQKVTISTVKSLGYFVYILYKVTLFSHLKIRKLN